MLFSQVSAPFFYKPSHYWLHRKFISVFSLTFIIGQDYWTLGCLEIVLFFFNSPTGLNSLCRSTFGVYMCVRVNARAHVYDVCVGYQAAYSQLAFAGKKERKQLGGDVTDPKMNLAKHLGKLATGHPGKVCGLQFPTGHYPVLVHVGLGTGRWYSGLFSELLHCDLAVLLYLSVASSDCHILSLLLAPLWLLQCGLEM